jgi:hypothetical protein
VKVSEAQLDIFRSLIDSDGLAMVDNFRPPLPLNTARRGRQAGGRMLFTTVNTLKHTLQDFRMLHSENEEHGIT